MSRPDVQSASRRGVVRDRADGFRQPLIARRDVRRFGNGSWVAVPKATSLRQTRRGVWSHRTRAIAFKAVGRRLPWRASLFFLHFQIRRIPPVVSKVQRRPHAAPAIALPQRARNGRGVLAPFAIGSNKRDWQKPRVRCLTDFGQESQAIGPFEPFCTVTRGGMTIFPE